MTYPTWLEGGPLRKIVLLTLAGFLMGCADESAPPDPPLGNTEVISAPVTPGGPEVVTPGSAHTFATGGATSTLGHPVEYRFDFDSDGLHDYSAWNPSNVAQKTWPTAGQRLVTAQARCGVHTTSVSEWSLGKNVEVGDGPDTEIMSVVNTYVTAAGTFSDILDVTDGVPDTVPYGSSITFAYKGIATPQGDNLCNDEINECLRYQVNYTCSSERNPGVYNTIAWRPFDPADGNLAGVLDSTALNVGSVDYAVRARSVDQFDRADVSPATIAFVGNFPPTLDSHSVINYDGTIVADGDTVVWDWWRPANFHGAESDTLDTSGLDTLVIKTFYFVVGAAGHDHAKEAVGSGVKSWKYSFREVGTVPPVFHPFARADLFVDGLMLNELADTAWVTFRYRPASDPGGTSILNNLPGYLNKEYDHTIIGQDLSTLEEFEQRLFYSGGLQLVNSYNTAAFGKWTAEGQQRFFLKLQR